MDTDDQPTAAMIERQKRIRAARDEFNAIWKREKATLSQAWGANMNRAELLAWRFYLIGKGIK